VFSSHSIGLELTTKTADTQNRKFLTQDKQRRRKNTFNKKLSYRRDSARKWINVAIFCICQEQNKEKWYSCECTTESKTNTYLKQQLIKLNLNH